MNTNEKPSNLHTKKIHRDSFNAQQSPTPNYSFRDPYERNRDYYLQRRAYEKGLDRLSMDLYIVIDRACEERGLERWQLSHGLEEGTEPDMAVMAAYLAIRSLSWTRISYAMETDTFLFAIDADFPAQAKVKRLYDQEDRRTYYYSLPVKAGERIEQIFKARYTKPEVRFQDIDGGDSLIKIRYTDDEVRSSHNLSDNVKRTIYEAVYIDSIDQILPIIEAHKSF